MKKIYQTPQMTATKLQTAHIIAVSELSKGEDITSGTIQGDVKGFNNRHGKNLWDEQW